MYKLMARTLTRGRRRVEGRSKSLLEMKLWALAAVVGQAGRQAIGRSCHHVRRGAARCTNNGHEERRELREFRIYMKAHAGDKNRNYGAGIESTIGHGEGEGGREGEQPKPHVTAYST